VASQYLTDSALNSVSLLLICGLAQRWTTK